MTLAARRALARVPAAVWAGLAVLVVQSAIEARWPRPAPFSKYELAARQLASGELAPERLADFSPLYLDLHRLALACRLDPPQELGALQALAVAVAAAFLFVLLRERLGPRLAAVGVAVFALDRHVLVYRTLLEPEAWLLLAVLAVWVLGRRSGRWAALGAGIAGGLGLAMRATLAPLLVLAPLAFYLDGDRGRRWLARTACFAAPLALAVAFLAVRAETATGSWRGPLMSPGTVFYEGNNPQSWGTSATYPPAVLSLSRHADRLPDPAHQHYRDVARGASGRRLDVAEVNAYWRSRALAFLGDEPAHALRRAVGKLTRCFQGFRWHDVDVAWRHDRRLASPAVPFSILAAFALLGLLLEARAWPRALLVYGGVASQVAVMVVFYVSARQRCPLVPGFVYFALVAVDALGRHPRRGWLLAGAALLSLALALPDDRVRDEVHQRDGRLRSQPLLAAVRAAVAANEPFDERLDEVLEGIAAEPWSHTRPSFFPQDVLDLETRIARRLATRGATSRPARYDLAVAHFEARELDLAEPLFAALDAEGFAADRRSNQPSLPGVYRARIAVRRGDPATARALLEAALAVAPGDLFALAELAALGDAQAGARLVRYASPPDAGFLIGDALLGQGRFAEAAAVLEPVVAAVPALREARMRRAAALAELGADEAAAEEYRRAASQALEPIVCPEAFGRLFVRWGEAHREEPARRLFAIQALEHVGRFAAAAALLEGWEPPEALRPLADEARRVAMRSREAETQLRP